jgi:NAD+ synthase (glutamine-hydrolysing)
MNDFGFTSVAAAIPELRVADCDFNTQQIKNLILTANEQHVQILAFPELSVTGYTCGDLFLQQALVDAAEQAVARLLEETRSLPICFILGAPVPHNAKLYNCALVCYNGKIQGIVPKTHLPNYSEFYEKRWFEPYTEEDNTLVHYAAQPAPFGVRLLFGEPNRRFAVEICEDLWAVIPPSSHHAIAGAQLLINLSASPELIGKQQYVKSLISQQSARCHAAYLYAAAGFGESTTDLVYAGNAYIYENGKLLAESKRFSFNQQLIRSEIDFDLLAGERKRNTTFPASAANYQTLPIPLTQPQPPVLTRAIPPTPFVPAAPDNDAACQEIFSIQVAGLAKRLIHTQSHALVLGISGGLDSTLALLVCVAAVDRLALPRTTIHGITMPGFGTTARTLRNATQLMHALGVTAKKIPIIHACRQHFKDIDHNPDLHDVTYENTQARERTQILMDLANQTNGLVIGTGDLSELALGWATYNGDHMSMYALNAGIPKTLVRHLIQWAAHTQIEPTARPTLLDIIDTPVSPELLPTDPAGQMTQFTEQTVGPYELHDFYLYYTLRHGFTPAKIHHLATLAFRQTYTPQTLLHWQETFYRRFFSNQFKRSCMPDGPKVGSVNLSPRGDWRMPSDASASLWLSEIQRLQTS